MELSVNFIVVFVISIVILFFGIKFIYDIMNMGEEVKLVLTKQVEDELGALAMQGKRISIAFNSEKIYPGKNHVFGLGVLNINATHKYFAIGVYAGPAYDRDNEEIREPKLQFLPNDGDDPSVGVIKETIALDELKKIPIGVKVPPGTKPGSYIVNVYVCNSDSTIGEYAGLCSSETPDENFYDKENPVRKIYVEVP